MHEQLRRNDRRRTWPLSVIVLLLLCLSAVVSVLGLLYAKRGHVAASSIAGPTAVDSSRARMSEHRNAEQDAEGIGLVVVVMPSPPMVSGPMTRIDRLRTIQDTWGRELVSKADSSGTAAAGGGVADNNR